MRIFLSSTVYDLIDIRAEVASLLRSLGVSPILSDDILSDFHIQQDINSIETCLINVSTSDEVIVILNQRYGPKLGRYGFEDISATHLEYKRAIKEKKPVYVFVRDRLQADYDYWKRNKNSDPNLTWIKKDDYGLFNLLDEHTKLSAKSKKMNWYSIFNSSCDLKEAISNHLQPKLLPQRLKSAIQENKFPLFEIKHDINFDVKGILQFNLYIINIGGTPAFNFKIYREDEPDRLYKILIITSGCSFDICYDYSYDEFNVDIILIAEYESSIGITVIDKFKISGEIIPDNIQPIIYKNACLEYRKFKRGVDVVLDIDD